MVNVAASPKARILERLRSSPDPVSGEELAAMLGVSRVAAWKQLESLREAGYGLESGHSGYRLASEGDFLKPWEFPGREARVVHYESTDSTMDRALELALADPGCGAIVVAETQARGRGRRGRPWDSPRGGLFATVAVAPGLAAARAALLPLFAASCLCEAMRSLSGDDFRVAWPNDVFLGGKKAAGVLAEYLVEGDDLRLALVGLGVNVANRAPGGSAISLADLPSPRPRRKDLLSAFLDRLEAGMPEGEKVAAAWNALSPREGSIVYSRDGGRRLGRALGVDSTGRLAVGLPGGRTASYGPGEALIKDKEHRT